MKNKVLFITPFLDYLGGIIFLWRFLKKFDRTQIEAAIYSHHYGELVNVMPPDIKQYFFHEKNESKYIYSFKRFWNRRNGKSPYLNKFLKIVKDFKPDVIVVNTISPDYVAEYAHNNDIKLVTIIHELPLGYTLVDYNGLKNIVELSDLLLGSSTLVCEELAKMGHKDTIVQHGFVDLAEIQIKQNRQEMRLALGIKPDEFVWVTAGSFSALKGGDLFLKLISHTLPDKVKFLWVGGMIETGYAYYAEKIIANQPKGKVIFTGYKKYDEYYDYLSLGDGFLLLSHSESFSLTTLEALSLGMPALCYDCGGVKDFINENNGIILKTRETNEWITTMCRIMSHELTFDNEKIMQSVSHLTSENQVNKMQENILSII
jgi:glycosyltransferase involved in cell wall biosynthesis